jgi:hypothetical protein
MRNYKKYRVRVLSLFQSFLANEIKGSDLINELSSIELEIKNGRKTLKGLWFRFFQGYTMATTIHNIDNYIYCTTNNKHIRECMQLSIDNPKELKIYFS